MHPTPHVEEFRDPGMRQNKGPTSPVLTALKMHGSESDDGSSRRKLKVGNKLVTGGHFSLLNTTLNSINIHIMRRQIIYCITSMYILAMKILL
jgi:hypothetical protein